MEVHHHSHSSRKNWSHYLWEFLMLFLAVFCGFFAEYLLEHKIEKEKEKQYISSLISDLKDDTAIINRQIDQIKLGARLFDSLSILLQSPDLAKANGEALYYCARRGIRGNPLANNNRTIEQLKNSGFRLIHNQETSNRIVRYYANFSTLRMLEEIFDRENDAFKKAASRVMDQSVYQRQIAPDGSVIRIPGPLSLLTYDPIALNELGFYAVQMNGSRIGMLPILDTLKKDAGELLGYLEGR